MPVGVTPISGEIPADKNELKVIMTAAPDAPADIPNVIVVGRIKGATASAPAMRVAVIK